MGRGNRKGTVESLVKWVEGNFLPGRRFANDADLVAQAAQWVEMTNDRSSDATGVPLAEGVRDEAVKVGTLPVDAHDYGFPRSARVSAESVLHLRGNVYSVPMAYVGTAVTARLHRAEVRIFHDTEEITRHRRARDGERRRVVDPEHFRPLFAKKPRARVMLYRQALLELSQDAKHYVSEVSPRRRSRLRDEVLGTYALLTLYGREALSHAMG